jgi:GNAT superfamily N-acetyltransferase
MDRQTPQFAIRLAMPADIPALHRLIELSVRGLQTLDYSPAQIEGALGHALGLDTQLVDDRTYFLAEPLDEPGTIAGCGGWSFRATLFGSDHGPHRAHGGGALLDPKVDAARIRAIFVHPAFARRGLGSQILAAAEAAAKTAGFSRFEMGSTLTGVPLYLLKGYIAHDSVEVPLPNGELLPVIRMSKNL